MSTKSSPRRVVRSAVLSFCSAAALSLIAGSALAAQEPAQKIVRFADLDLAKTQDATELYSRLEHAARSVCRTYAGHDLERKLMRLECEAGALAAAVAEIDDAALSALHTAERRVRLAQGR
jgi:UrcA family protein